MRLPLSLLLATLSLASVHCEDGGGAADGGLEPPEACDWTLGTETEIASGVLSPRLAVAARADGFSVGWLDDSCTLTVRRVGLDGLAVGASENAFSTACSSQPRIDLAAAVAPQGPVFFALTDADSVQVLTRVTLFGGPASSEIDSAGDTPGLAATVSAGGVATLWLQKESPATDAPSVVRLQREGGSLPLIQLDTALPTLEARRHSIAAQGDGLAVAWQSAVGALTPITGARLGNRGEVLLDSQRALSLGGSRNVAPRLVATTGGLALAWIQEEVSTRSAMVARLDDELDSVDGDLPVGEMGVTGSVESSLAAAAIGTRVAVVFTRHDATGLIGFSIGGIDRVSGDVLGRLDFDRDTLTEDVEIEAAASGDTLLVAFVDDGRVKTLTATCE